jgi:hypothetical protein
MRIDGSRRADIALGGALFLLALALYLRTLAPSVVAMFDDSLEFQLVCPTLGIAHPTGYPLYTLLGWLFTLLPVGDAAYRVNLMSAFSGALTVALLYPAIKALTPTTMPQEARRLGAFVGPLIGLAVSPVFWSQATVAEVYTLNSAFVALLLALLLSASQLTDLYLVAAVYGLSLTHHRTMALLAPAMLAYPAALKKVQLTTLKKPSVVLRLLLALLAPLLLYLYIPLRGTVTTSLDGTYVNTPGGFWQQVTASGYNLFLAENPLAGSRPLWFYLRLFFDQFGPLGLVMGLLGLLWLLRRPPELALTGGAFACYTAFGLLYHVPDVEVFFIPSFLIYTLWIGAGIALATSWVIVAAYHPSSPLPGRLLTGDRLLAVLFVILFAPLLSTALDAFREHFPAQDRSRAWQVHDYGLDVLGQSLGEKPAIVGILGEMTLLRYFQRTQGVRPDVLTVAADDEQERLATVERLLRAGHTVYLTRPLPGAAERWSLASLGPLVRVRDKPLREPPADVRPVQADLTPALRLVGYDLQRVGPPAGDRWRLADLFPGPAAEPGAPRLRLTLYWQPLSKIAEGYKVSARLVRGDELLAQSDAVPVHFAYPTTAWRPGEIISDVYDLEPPDDESGLGVLVILYDPATLQQVGEVRL